MPQKPPVEARVKDLLDETRLAMLGIQILIGLQYRAAFSPGFKRLTGAFQALDCIALLLILTSAGLLFAVPAFHQISEQGHATGRLIARASGNLHMALMFLGVALGIDISIGISSTTGETGAAIAGFVFVCAVLLMWHLVPVVAARRRPRRESGMEDKQQSLEARIVQMLTELRVILPGAQALFGFQVSAVLTEAFPHLSNGSKIVHLGSLGLVAVAIIMLIAPAAYHRIAARGDAEESVLRYSVCMMLPAEGLIALGLIGDAYVTVRMISESHFLALAVGIAAAVGFAVLLYGLPLAARHIRERARRVCA
jgi:hypothetical protein